MSGLFCVDILSVTSNCFFESFQMLKFYIPFKRQGHIATDPQNCHLWKSSPPKVTVFDKMPNLLNSSPPRISLLSSKIAILSATCFKIAVRFLFYKENQERKYNLNTIGILIVL